MNENKISVSNILIFFSFFATLIVTYDERLYQFGMNLDFFNQGIYHVWLIQFFTSQFLHADFFHFISNAFFLLYFGNIVEQYIGKQAMIVFFVGNSMFLGVLLTILGVPNTVGISGFALALLTYYTLLLWKKGNPEYTGGITAIVLHVMLGFVPGISFWGHFGGMIFGAVFFFFSLLFTPKNRKI